MVSPWPSCMSAPDSVIVSPPIWRTPTSKEIRVRVEGFSKIRATMRPASGWSSSGAPFGRSFRAIFIAWAASIICRSAPGSVLWMSRKWFIWFAFLDETGARGPSAPSRSPEDICGQMEAAGRVSVLCGGLADRFGGAFEPHHRLGDLLAADRERGEHADDVVGGAHREDVLGIARRDEICVRTPALEAEHQAGPADLLEDHREGRDEPLEALAQKTRLAVDIAQECRVGDEFHHAASHRAAERISS